MGRSSDPPGGGGGAEDRQGSGKGPGRVRALLPDTFPHTLTCPDPEGRRLERVFQAEGQLGFCCPLSHRKGCEFYPSSQRLPVSLNPQQHWEWFPNLVNMLENPILFPFCCVCLQLLASWNTSHCSELFDETVGSQSWKHQVSLWTDR